MAAAPTEAPRSSYVSADSYVGSLISLTSKSEIRYEGILFNINTDESNIGLRNVRSFGTEGRKKDGPQVPSSDKIYEYILFRGSDIKDLQVKSSPPVQTATPVYNDPAIIQAHYPQAPNASTNLTSGSGSIPDVGSQNLQMGLPLYQPVRGLGSWGSSPSPSPPTTNGNGLALPMYWQGFYGSSNGFQSQQQSLLRPPPGLSIPPSAQQAMQYPSMSMSLPFGASNMSALNSSESSSVLFPPINTSNLNMQSSLFPTSGLNLQPSILPTSGLSLQSSIPTTSPSLQSSILPKSSPSLLSSIFPTSSPNLQSSIHPSQSPLSVGTFNLQSPLLPDKTTRLVSDSSTNSVSSKAPFEAPPSAASSNSLSLASSSTISLDKSTQLSPVSDKPASLVMPLKTSDFLSVAGLSELSSITGTSRSILNEGTMPSLITPGQLLQPGPSTTVSSAQSPQTSKRNIDSLQLPSEVPLEAPDPILPLPSPSDHKPQGSRMFTRHYYRGGRERGRGNGMSHPLTRFKEDFDFIAMNEKFNKDEIWGDLGKSSKKDEDDSREEDVESPKPEKKPVYVKDDFFDSLSCDTLDRGSHQSRPKFSEQLKKDTETFGHVPRHWGGRRGRGPGRGGRSNGGYYGLGFSNGHGYGYVGRGRGHGFYGRAG